MGNSKRCGMTFTDKIQPLNYYKTQGYPIPIILSLLLGMTFGTLKFTSRRKLNSAYLYTNLHIQICVAEWRRKQRFFLYVYLTQKVCEVCRLFNSSSNFYQGLDYWLTDKSSFIKKIIIGSIYCTSFKIQGQCCGMTLRNDAVNLLKNWIVHPYFK